MNGSTDQWMDEWTDQRTYQWMVRPFYGDARTHLTRPIPAIRCAWLAFLRRRYGPTDGRTDGPTDKGSYGVACPQLKT